LNALLGSSMQAGRLRAEARRVGAGSDALRAAPGAAPRPRLAADEAAAAAGVAALALGPAAATNHNRPVGCDCGHKGRRKTPRFTAGGIASYPPAAECEAERAVSACGREILGGSRGAGGGVKES